MAGEDAGADRDSDAIGADPADPSADRGPALTEYAELHGCSCKIGQSDLESLLAETGLDADRPELLFGVGEDAAARTVTDDRATVSTIDFFTPIIDDPYAYGRVAACNAASDAFAKGATEELSFLVVLGLPRELTDAAPAILDGIADGAASVDGVVAGGHSVLNPWPLAGAAVTATAHPDDLVTTDGATPGDRLYLTKPLGTQPAMGALRVQSGEFGDTVRGAPDRSIPEIGEAALRWMTTPNRGAAEAFGEAPVTAATDVTGFGLLGQAEHLAANASVGIEITHLPVIAGTPPLSDLFGYGLLEGESAETSGGLLVAVAQHGGDDFEAVLDDRGIFYREVGRVTEPPDVALVDPTVEEV
ncbi:MAG: selenide,water dikinase [Natronomonas sp.]|jgi:selenide,water dikinase